MTSKITILMGSKSDQAISEKVTKILNEFGVDFDIHIASAHRTPGLVKEIIEESGAKVFIAIAGLSAALPGVVAAHTTKPVIGVPVSGKVNLDSILSIVQMPPGIPVGAVGLDNGSNAALLALEILAINDQDLTSKIIEYRAAAQKKIIDANKSL